MKTVEKVREELESVKRYYAHKDRFDKAFNEGKQLHIKNLVNEYEDVMLLASPKLYDVYCAIYKRGLTQEACATEFDITWRHFNRLFKNVLVFLSQNVG